MSSKIEIRVGREKTLAVGHGVQQHAPPSLTLLPFGTVEEDSDGLEQRFLRYVVIRSIRVYAWKTVEEPLTRLA